MECSSRHDNARALTPVGRVEPVIDNPCRLWADGHQLGANRGDPVGLGNQTCRE